MMCHNLEQMVVSLYFHEMTLVNESYSKNKIIGLKSGTLQINGKICLTWRVRGCNGTFR